MIKELYRESLKKSPLADHLPFLKFLATQPHIRDILEIGAAEGDSTLAFLMGNPKELISIDIDSSILMQKLPIKEHGNWIFILQNPYHPDLNFHADLLFANNLSIKSLHENIRKWIVLYKGNFENPSWKEVYSYKDLLLLERIL